MLILLFAISAAITYEDFKHRAVHWWLFGGFGILSLIYFSANGFLPETSNIVMNIGFIITQLAVSFLYLSLRRKRTIKLGSEYIGWGDIVLFLLLCPLFETVIFLVFFTATLSASLIIGKILKMKTIPLAGIQSAAFIIYATAVPEITQYG